MYSARPNELKRTISNHIQGEHKTPDQTPPRQSEMGQTISSEPDGQSERGKNAMPHLSFQWGMCRLTGLWIGRQAGQRSVG